MLFVSGGTPCTKLDLVDTAAAISTGSRIMAQAADTGAANTLPKVILMG